MAAKKKAAKKGKAAASKKKAAPAKKKAAPAKKAAAKRPAARPAPPMPNQIVHWEIQAKDPGVVQQFYRDVFGWTIDTNNPMNYGMVASGGKDGIDGGIGGNMQGDSRVVVYASVKDINATLAKAEQHGARTVMPRTDVGPVIIALYTDPEGNVMGLLEGG
jgi:predicted enzyme related to lactoylglutathione lyase